MQAINSPEACKRRLFKYVIPVVILSVFVNVPKFFESELYDVPLIPPEITKEYWEANNLTASMFNSTKRIQVTQLRKDPNYTIYYNNWARLSFIGIVPMILLIYFNYKVSLRSNIRIIRFRYVYF